VYVSETLSGRPVGSQDAALDRREPQLLLATKLQPWEKTLKGIRLKSVRASLETSVPFLIR